LRESVTPRSGEWAAIHREGEVFALVVLLVIEALDQPTKNTKSGIFAREVLRLRLQSGEFAENILRRLRPDEEFQSHLAFILLEGDAESISAPLPVAGRALDQVEHGLFRCKLQAHDSRLVPPQRQALFLQPVVHLSQGGPASPEAAAASGRSRQVQDHHHDKSREGSRGHAVVENDARPGWQQIGEKSLRLETCPKPESDADDEAVPVRKATVGHHPQSVAEKQGEG